MITFPLRPWNHWVYLIRTVYWVMRHSRYYRLTHLILNLNSLIPCLFESRNWKANIEFPDFFIQVDKCSKGFFFFFSSSGYGMDMQGHDVDLHFKSTMEQYGSDAVPGIRDLFETEQEVIMSIVLNNNTKAEVSKESFIFSN